MATPLNPSADAVAAAQSALIIAIIGAAVSILVAIVGIVSSYLVAKKQREQHIADRKEDREENERLRQQDRALFEHDHRKTTIDEYESKQFWELYGPLTMILAEISYLTLFRGMNQDVYSLSGRGRFKTDKGAEWLSKQIAYDNEQFLNDVLPKYGEAEELIKLKSPLADPELLIEQYQLTIYVEKWKRGLNEDLKPINAAMAAFEEPVTQLYLHVEKRFKELYKKHHPHATDIDQFSILRDDGSELVRRFKESLKWAYAKTDQDELTIDPKMNDD